MTQDQHPQGLSFCRRVGVEGITSIWKQQHELPSSDLKDLKPHYQRFTINWGCPKEGTVKSPSKSEILRLHSFNALQETSQEDPGWISSTYSMNRSPNQKLRKQSSIAASSNRSLRLVKTSTHFVVRWSMLTINILLNFLSWWRANSTGVRWRFRVQVPGRVPCPTGEMDTASPS
jgi:hypothetical protein